MHLNINGWAGNCGGTLVTCHHVLTARHCIAMTDNATKANAYGYRPNEILSAEYVTVAVGSITRNDPRLVDPKKMAGGVQQIRATDSEYPDLAVIVLRGAINPTLPNMRPVKMLGNRDAMDPGDVFTAVGWGLTGASPDSTRK